MLAVSRSRGPISSSHYVLSISCQLAQKFFKYDISPQNSSHPISHTNSPPSTTDFHGDSHGYLYKWFSPGSLGSGGDEKNGSKIETIPKSKSSLNQSRAATKVGDEAAGRSRRRSNRRREAANPAKQGCQTGEEARDPGGEVKPLTAEELEQYESISESSDSDSDDGLEDEEEDGDEDEDDDDDDDDNDADDEDDEDEDDDDDVQEVVQSSGGPPVQSIDDEDDEEDEEEAEGGDDDDDGEGDDDDDEGEDEVTGALRAGAVEYPERLGQPVCQYYMRTGMSKFGATCKYHHPKQGGGSAAPVSLNYYGYPLRPDGANESNAKVSKREKARLVYYWGPIHYCGSVH
ncbi:uncharacterized protein LOC133730620 [Rosa rugosa]|uniref:uncharacterized protein LOC133730620 n=1 Tax=Rosa rugosa TaxID=74645 RepID=UPI002B415E4A|nr:uncharacterized protein LOC133730620 [Rosa rugosa]